MDEKSSQTSEMTVKISEKRSSRASVGSPQRGGRVTTPPSRRCTMVRLCVVFLKVKMYSTEKLLFSLVCRMLAPLNIERLNVFSNISTFVFSPASAEPTVDRLERFSDYLQLIHRVLTA